MLAVWTGTLEVVIDMFTLYIGIAVCTFAVGVRRLGASLHLV